MRRLTLSATRRLLLWFFDEPSNDPYVSLNFDVDLAPARTFIAAFEREHGERIGIQHLLTKAVARCLTELPALNVKILGRAIYGLDVVNVAMPVHLGREGGGDETGMAVVHAVDKKTLLQIARETRSRAAAERNDEPAILGSGLVRRLFKSVPDRVMYAGLDAVGYALGRPSTQHLLGDWVGVSSAVTNVGAVFSLPRGARFRSVSATVPAKLGPVASIFGVAPAEEAIVSEGGRAVTRTVLPIIMVVDHRAIDGYLMAVAARHLAEALLDPARLAPA